MIASARTIIRSCRFSESGEKYKNSSVRAAPKAERGGEGEEREGNSRKKVRFLSKSGYSRISEITFS